MALTIHHAGIEVAIKKINQRKIALEAREAAHAIEAQAIEQERNRLFQDQEAVATVERLICESENSDSASYDDIPQFTGEQIGSPSVLLGTETVPNFFDATYRSTQ